MAPTQTPHKDCAGGGAIADTGDYAECVCPECFKKGAGDWVIVEDAGEHIANLESKLAASEEARKKAERHYNIAFEEDVRLAKKLEAAEARIKASQEQEPVVQRMMSRLAELLDEDQFAEMEGIANEAGIFPPELSKVVRERDELRRKLAEQQSHNNFDAARLRRLVSFCGVAAPESDEELLQVAGVVIGSCLRVLQNSRTKP